MDVQSYRRSAAQTGKCSVVATKLPRGEVSVQVVYGGLDIFDDAHGTR